MKQHNSKQQNSKYGRMMSNYQLKQRKITKQTNKTINRKYRNTKQQIEYNNFLCKICKSIKLNSTLIDCGHDFCQGCIYQYIQLFSKCILCKQQIKCFYKNYLIDNQIKSFIEQQSQSVQQKFKKRVEIDKQYIPKNKNEMKFRIGMELDVLDNNFVWQKGLIKQIRKSNKKQIEYVEIQLHKKYLIVDTNERRFQELGYFSEQKEYVKYMDFGRKVWLNYVLSDDSDDNK